MTRHWPSVKPTAACLFLILLCALLLTVFDSSPQAMTISVGEPSDGSLVNGVQFPSQLPGYKVRDEERSYTTPELVGSMLDAFDRFTEKHPDSCDVFFGDFSRLGGGPINHHRSHENGRDVDMGMFAKDNVPLNGFIPMNSDVLDVPKTWDMIQCLLGTQRIEHIFMDRSIQESFYHYALSKGVEPAYLQKVFQVAGGSIIEHWPGHRDHMHIRFFAPWSTLAGQMRHIDPQKQMMIEVAQQSYLPKRVNYYARGNEKDLAQLAYNFGVTPKDLCKWNGLSGNQLPKPGECLVYYKRGFEVEPVHLARSLQPHNIIDATPVFVASAARLGVSDEVAPAPSAPVSVAKAEIQDEKPRRESVRVHMAFSPVDSPRTKRMEYSARAASNFDAPAKTAFYTVRRGDSLRKLADEYGLKVETLCRMNGIKRTAHLKPGRKLKLAAVEERPRSSTTAYKMSAFRIASAHEGLPGVTRNGKIDKMAKLHTIRDGETLWDVAKRYQVNTETICRLNHLSGKSILQPGMAIKLPQH